MSQYKMSQIGPQSKGFDFPASSLCGC